jgi:hypothetical protein
MVTLQLSAFGMDPSAGTNYLMWVPLLSFFLLALIIGIIYRNSQNSYFRYQGLIWSLVVPLLTLALAMSIPEHFGNQFGVVTALAMIVAGAGVDRMISWTGSPFTAMLMAFSMQGIAMYVVAVTSAGCPVPKIDPTNKVLNLQQGPMAQAPMMPAPMVQAPMAMVPAPMMQAPMTMMQAPMMQAPMMMQPVMQPQMVQAPVMMQAPMMQSQAAPAAVPVYIK